MNYSDNSFIHFEFNINIAFIIWGYTGISGLNKKVTWWSRFDGHFDSQGNGNSPIIRNFMFSLTTRGIQRSLSTIIGKVFHIYKVR